jgi:hypothetical protein
MPPLRVPCTQERMAGGHGHVTGLGLGPARPSLHERGTPPKPPRGMMPRYMQPPKQACRTCRGASDTNSHAGTAMPAVVPRPLARL